MKLKLDWSYVIVLVLIGTLISAVFFLDPFSSLLLTNKVSVSALGNSQRLNIDRACKKLDGYILKPGQVFSFNNVLGPRSADAGYSQSPSYLDKDSPKTFGGGICLLSSLLYKSALELGLKVEERHAHTRTTQFIQSGFDATVWYDSLDLKFKNNLKDPLKLECKIDDQNLTVNLYGSDNPKAETKLALQRLVQRLEKDNIAVTVFRKKNDKLHFLTRDLYRISRQSSDFAQSKAYQDKDNKRI